MCLDIVLLLSAHSSSSLRCACIREAQNNFMAHIKCIWISFILNAFEKMVDAFIHTLRVILVALVTSRNTIQDADAQTIWKCSQHILDYELHIFFDFSFSIKRNEIGLI